MECKLALSYAHSMYIDQRLDVLEAQLDKAIKLLMGIQQKTAGAWALSPIQEVRRDHFFVVGYTEIPTRQTALKDLLRHQMVSPALSLEPKHIVLTAMVRFTGISIGSVLIIIQNYISKHRQKYHIESFTTDEIIKSTMKKFLADNVANVKSQFRKRVSHTTFYFRT